MNILHVSSVRDLPQSGVATVVPGHVSAQSQYTNVALLNISNFIPSKSKNTFPVYLASNYSSIGDLPGVFSNPDLVIFHEVYWLPYIRMYKYLKKNNIPYIIIPHVSLTRVAQQNKRLKKIVGNKLFFSRFIRNAEAIQYLSQSEMSESKRFNTIPSIIRSNAVDETGRSKEYFGGDNLNLIYVGRFDFKIKGIDLILETANILKNKMKRNDIHFTLAGTSRGDNMERILTMIAQYDLSSVVKVQPAVFGSEKIDAILANDVFIQLSRTEGQPLGVMEAMEIGMPCIVTRGTTFYDIAKKYEVAIPVEDSPMEIANSIIQVLNNKKMLDKISKRASEYIHKEYSWKSVSQSTLASYEKILKR